MLSEERPALSSMLFWGMALDGALGMTGRVTVSSPGERDAGLPDLAPTLTRDVARAFAASAIGVNIALSVIDVWRLVYLPVAPGAVRAAIIAAAIAIPLHIRHVIYGLRGERPPFGAFTLAVLAVVNAVAWRVAGPGWIFQFASLAVSILIVVPGSAGLVLAAAVVLSPLVLQGPQWFATAPNIAGIYLAFSIAWRSTTQFVPLRLMAAIRALDLAGRELESRAVVQTRVRIDAELRDGVASALEQIVARGEAARRAAGAEPARATADLRSGLSTIPASAITWTSTGSGFVGGTLSAAAAQTVASWIGSGVRTGTQSFIFRNLWSYPTGTYTLTMTFTLSAA